MIELKMRDDKGGKRILEFVNKCIETKPDCTVEDLIIMLYKYKVASSEFDAFCKHSNIHPITDELSALESKENFKEEK